MLVPVIGIAAKNGVYFSLVKDVRHAFEVCELVKIDCKGMHASDYKKIGAKLKVFMHFIFGQCDLPPLDDDDLLYNSHEQKRKLKRSKGNKKTLKYELH